MPRAIIDTRAPTTIKREVVDFTAWLEPTETISSATVAMLVTSGTDSNPSALLSGAPTINGNQVQQFFQGGLDGVNYGAVWTAFTSMGQKLQVGTYLAVLGGS